MCLTNCLKESALMLRNRSRAVTSKQALMADQASLLSPTRNPASPISSFLGSPRFFNGFLSKNLFDAEITAMSMSPTSILDTKNSSSFVNPFGYDRNLSKPRELNSTNKTETEAIGLALIDSIIEEKFDGNGGKFFRPINRMALLGSKLKVQIPAPNPASSLSPGESPESPADFGIKTRNSQFLSPFTGSPAKDFARQLSLKEMELSEDYTCVITHGPKPKTTHIYDDCIVGSCTGDDDDDDDNDDEEETSEDKEEDYGFETNVSTSSSSNFLSFCHTCKGVLEQDREIYIYRGEKAFCSQECRCQEMFIEGTMSPGLDNAF